MAAYQGTLSLGFSRQEHWRGLPFPSPIHESEKWKWSRWVVSDSLRPHALQPSRLLHPWDFPGKSTGVGCHCLLRSWLKDENGKLLLLLFRNWNSPYLSQTSPLILLPKLANGLLVLRLYFLCCCSVTKSCPTLCDPMDCSTPGFPALHYLPEFAQTHVHWVSDAIQISVIPFSSCLRFFPASESFIVSQLFASGGQSIQASALASVLPMNIQDGFPLRLTGFISLQ